MHCIALSKLSERRQAFYDCGKRIGMMFSICIADLQRGVSRDVDILSLGIAKVDFVTTLLASDMRVR